MGALVESASLILSQSERRLELSAQNISNISTPGFKKSTSFQALFSPERADNPKNYEDRRVDFSSGKEINTGNSYDLAILGDGFFAVRSDERVLYTRQGQFQRDADGRLTLGAGFAVQTQGGGDLVLKSHDFKVLADGTVLDAGQPAGRLAIVDFENRQALTPTQGLFEAPAETATSVDAPSVRQGELEASNVSTGDEMLTIMQALRRAEAAQRVINIYDDLMGRALTSFGQP